MAKQTVGLGTVADDGTGDDARVAFDKLNDNNDELYTELGDGTTLGSIQRQPTEGAFANGDKTRLDLTFTYQGLWDASSGSFPGGGTGNIGDIYLVQFGGAGTVDSQVFAENDLIMAFVNNASTTTFTNNWIRIYNGDFNTATTLASTASGGGASLVGVEDAVGQFAEATVEGVLDELQGNIDSLENYTNTTFIGEGDLTDRVQAVNLGGDATAAVPTTPNQNSIYGWFQNGYDAPDNAQNNDIYNLPDGLDVLTAEATAARDLTTSDVGGEIRFTGTDPVYTIELEATNAVNYGASAMPWVDLINDSSTNLTVQGATSVTVNGTSAGSAVIKPGGRGRVWRTTTADTWLVFGDLVDYELETIQVVCSAAGEDLATGPAVVTFRMPFAMTLTDVRASVATAPSGGGISVDINEGGTTILSPKLPIDVGDKTSEDAGSPVGISDSALADDAEITIDIDAVGSTVAGTDLVVTLIGHRA